MSESQSPSVPAPASRSPAGQSAARDQGGFSLVEVLVISVLVLVILLALVPLFSHSMMSNLEAWEATQAIGFGRSEVEEKSSVPLDRPPLVAAGTDLQKTSDSVWDDVEMEWLADGDPDAPASTLWERHTRVRLYSLSDIVAGSGSEARLSTPLPADTDPRFVHFREITVHVDHQKQTGAVGANRGLDVTVLRSY